MTIAPRKDFTSDNITGASPKVMSAIAGANHGTQPSYGADSRSLELTSRMSELFERPVAVLPVATGTAANALALALLARPYEAIYCQEGAHVMTDECGAPEFYSSGAKLIGLPSVDGRIDAAQLETAVCRARSQGVHHVQPAAISVSQATEWGTVYQPQDLRRLSDRAHALGLRVHMDGARFANAVAHLACSPAQTTWQAGVDVLSFGATKNGALAAEAVVLFDTDQAGELELRRKRGGHLWSKSRFLSAQLLAMLQDDLWLTNARRANEMARQLSIGLSAIPGVTLLQPVEANEIFLTLPGTIAGSLRAQGFSFYDWPAPTPTADAAVRLVTSYETRAEDVEGLIDAAMRLVG